MLELLADGLSRVEGKKQKIPAGENKTFEQPTVFPDNFIIQPAQSSTAETGFFPFRGGLCKVAQRL